MAVAWFMLIGATFVFGVVSFAVLQPKIFMITAGVLFVLMLCGAQILGVGMLLMLGGGSKSVLTKAEAMVGMPPEAAMEGFPVPNEVRRKWKTRRLPRLSKAPRPPPRRASPPVSETLFWQPERITNDAGEVELPLELADSITTWRLSASA